MNSNNHLVAAPRIRETLNVIYEFALGNLKARGTISELNDELDALITGINILGEEMEARIAERRKADENLRESEALFRNLFDNALVGILIVDIETRKFLKVNRTMCNMLGYDEKEIKNIGLMDIHPEKDLPYIMEQFEKQSKKEGGGLYGIPLKRKDGSVIYADVSGAPMTLQGRAYQIGIFRDITERRKVEEDLKESEVMFRGIFDSAWDGIMIADSETKKVIMGNRAICSALGYNEEEIKNLCIEDFHDEKDLPYVLEQFGKLRRREIGVVRDLPMKRKDGSVYYADLGPGAMTLKGRMYQIGILRDITDRKQAEEEISRLNEDLKMKVKELFETQEELIRKEKLSILGQIAGSIGHELRSPLGVMSNAVYFLQMVLPDADDTVKEYLGIIKKEIDSSEQIISDLLGFARTMTPQTQSTTVNELLEKGLRKCAVPENVAIEMEIHHALPAVNVDPLQMSQVFQNLIMNGIQAMPDGGSLRITARMKQGSTVEVQGSEMGGRDFIEITVTDTGEGISPENMKKIFQPLFTTKARGIGLGLSVVKNLIEANGGRIEVESGSGKGTTFTVIVPCKRG